MDATFLKPMQLFGDPHVPIGAGAADVDAGGFADARNHLDIVRESNRQNVLRSFYKPLGIHGSRLATWALAPELTGMPQKSKKGPRLRFTIVE